MTDIEKDFRDRAALLAAIEETSLDAIITITDHGLIRSFSPAAEKLFGSSKAEVMGQNVKILMPPSYAHHHDGYMQRYLATGERRIIGIGRIVSGQRRDGSTFPMELAVGETKIDGSRVFVGFVRDLTQMEREHRRVAELQSELFHVSRLGEMGQMTSGLAHEVNQPLAAIMNYAEAGRQLARPDDQARDPRLAVVDIFDRIERQAARAAEIVKRLRAFVEKRQAERNIEDLNVLIEEAVALALVGMSSRNVRVHFALGPKRSRVYVDGVQIQQVLVNLLRNALDAMEGQPTREITLSADLATPGFIRVSVADSGPGIDPDVASKLFEAFVTTKRTGMGVGLAISRQIIEAHGGRIWCERAAGPGAIFRFTLPLQQADPETGDA